MQSFELEERFGLAFIALGSFYDLRTLEAQEQTLRAIHSHLRPGGRVVIDLFLPTAAYVGRAVDCTQPVDMSDRVEVGRFAHPETGLTYVVWEASNHVPHEQTFTIQRTIETRDAEGRVVEERPFRICGRYVHRYEMQHLLRLCGYQDIKLYGDYEASAYGARSSRQIWVASAR